MMKWVILCAVCAGILITGICLHYLAVVVLSFALLVGGLVLFDAFEYGTDNKTIDAIVRFFEGR